MPEAGRAHEVLEYVAVITSIYRRLLDEKRRPTREERRQLELAFSRSGFTDGYYLGRKGPQMFGTLPENVPEPKELFAEARTLYEKGGSPDGGGGHGLRLPGR